MFIYLKNISKSDIGIAATENATSGINSLLDDVRQRVITEVNKTLCCQEENQILNQYCASIDLVSASACYLDLPLCSSVLTV